MIFKFLKVKIFQIPCFVLKIVVNISNYNIIILFRLKRELHPNQKLACFVLYLKIINTFLENNICILKQIVQETQKWNWSFSKPSSFKLWNKIVLINNSRTAGPT